MKVWVGRSPWRMLAYTVVGAALVVLAVDMTVSYRFFPYPDHTVTEAEDATGTTTRVLTLDGEVQRRRDLAFGVTLGLGGGALLLWSVREVIVRRPLLVADETGLTVRLGTRREPPLHLEWGDIAEVRSGSQDDGAGTVPVLSLRLADSGLMPQRPHAAIADPPWLHLIADEWDLPPRQVAPAVSSRLAASPEDQYH